MGKGGKEGRGPLLLRAPHRNMTKRGSKAEYFVAKDINSNCYIKYSYQDYELSGARQRGQGGKKVNIATFSSESDASLFSTCKNLRWTEDFIYYLELQDRIISNAAAGIPLPDESQYLPMILQYRKDHPDKKCFGNCQSIAHNDDCYACYHRNYELWAVCAKIKICKTIKKLYSSDNESM